MLLVNGMCTEPITVPASASNVTLDGQGTATIQVADAAPLVVSVLGREITVRGFTLSGGRNGVGVFRGGTAVIDGNTIQNSGAGGQPGSGLGINVAQNSFAAIVNNTITHNRSAGILVHEGSSARIGFIDVAATGAPNLIQDNGDAGILVSRGASARVVAATIIGNGGDGIFVERESQLEAANNTISGNRGDGIRAVEGSGVVIEVGAATVTQPNTTDANQQNGGFGLACSIGGYVRGPLGSLGGTKGPRSIDRSCVDASTA
jgi:nitrous oxidase accessory protein NosD